MNTGVTTEEALASAARLRATLRERSAATNRARRIPDETMSDLIGSGLFRLLQPVRYGGVEQDLETFVRAVIELSRGCGSAGWVFSVLSIHQWLIGLFPDEAQRDVWGSDARVLACSSFHPGGKVSREQGGYRVEGKWGFCSGCDHTQWIIIAGFLGMTGAPPRPDVKLFLVPMSACRIHDDWNVMGLQGTGSKSVIVSDAFVPEHRVLDFADAREARSPGKRANPGPLYQLPAWANFPICLASPAVGIAWGAYERFLAYLKSRSNVAGKKIAEYASIQTRVAESAAMIDAAELLLRRDARETFDAAMSGAALGLPMRVRNRRDHGYAALLASQATEKLLRACGAQGLFDDSEIQQCHRDAYAAAAHIGTNWDMAASIFGASTLGLPVAEAFY